MTAVVAFVPNMMDRSRFPAASVRFVDQPDDIDADAVVIVDIDRCEDLAGFAAAGATVIGFGSHVDDDRLALARHVGFDEVMARSVFFRRLPELVGVRNGER
jgi:hypothetical protein